MEHCTLTVRLIGSIRSISRLSLFLGYIVLRSWK